MKTIIAPLFPETVVTEEADPERIQGTLYPEEEALIRSAVYKRKQEFIAGRLCARKALSKLGVFDFPIVNTKDRTPVWPLSIVGSISHAEGYCGVALAREEEFRSVGLDVECTGRIERDLWRRICVEEEIFWLNTLPPEDQGNKVSLIFSSKECLYKCQYAITKQWVGFHDVVISVIPGKNEFEATFRVDVGEFYAKGTSHRGKYLFHNGYVCTGMTIKNTGNTGIK